MRLVLIRHGESVDQTRKVLSGQGTCAGLSDRGFLQARALADRIRTTGEFSACEDFLCSTVRRARETAEVLMDALPVSSYQEDENLGEILFGEAEGLTQEASGAKYGMSTPTGGESWRLFRDRVGSTLDRYSERFGGRTVVAVTHAGFVLASMIELFGGPETRAWLDPSNTGITEWYRSEGKWTLVKYNDFSHLCMVNGEG